MRAVLFTFRSSAFTLLPAAGQNGETSIRITSPLGRTGVPGVVRVVAQVVTPVPGGVVPVRFFVDDTLLGEDIDGPPYVAEWEDLNPYEARVIRAEIDDGKGGIVEDRVSLASLELIEEAFVASVLVEATVTDEAGRYVSTSRRSDFALYRRRSAPGARPRAAADAPDDVHAAGRRLPEHVAPHRPGARDRAAPRLPPAGRRHGRRRAVPARARGGDRSDQRRQDDCRRHCRYQGDGRDGDPRFAGCPAGVLRPRRGPPGGDPRHRRLRRAQQDDPRPGAARPPEAPGHRLRRRHRRRRRHLAAGGIAAPEDCDADGRQGILSRRGRRSYPTCTGSSLPRPTAATSSPTPPPTRRWTAPIGAFASRSSFRIRGEGAARVLRPGAAADPADDRVQRGG